MRNTPSTLSAPAWFLIAASCVCGSARADRVLLPLRIESSTVTVLDGGDVYFELDFDRPLRLTADPAAASPSPVPIDSFQILLDLDGGGPVTLAPLPDPLPGGSRGPVANAPADVDDPLGLAWDVVVRGDELLTAGEILFRDTQGVDGGPAAGGWGPVLSTAPYTLSDNRSGLAFTAAGLVREAADVGGLRYEATATVRGLTTDSVVPLPSGTLCGFVGLLMLASRRRQREN